jgi:myo-inositol 2-dehydrogenase / D-chiro-inositol 1-dehydrogenase
VVISFDNGACAVDEANFSAAYGYDIRGAVFGSERVVTVGGGARSSAQVFTSSGWSTDTVRSDTELMRDAYTGEFVEFAAAIRECRKPSATGFDAQRALAVALACIESVQTHDPVARALANSPRLRHEAAAPPTVRPCQNTHFDSGARLSPGAA